MKIIIYLVVLMAGSVAAHFLKDFAFTIGFFTGYVGLMVLQSKKLIRVSIDYKEPITDRVSIDCKEPITDKEIRDAIDKLERNNRFPDKDNGAQLV